MAETAQAPADDGFVERVSDEVARHRWRQAAWRSLVALALFLTALAAAPYLMDSAGRVVRVSERLTIPLTVALTTPTGWAVSGLVAVWILLRAGVSAGRRRRRAH
jgi:hypothetical protein